MTDFNFITPKTDRTINSKVVFEFGTGSFQLLAGQSNIMTAIWADSTASRASGKLYITSYGEGAAFSVLDLKIKSLYDSCTITQKGRANELLAQEDPIDVVAGGL